MIASIIINVILLIALIISITFNVKLAKFAMAFEDNVTSCLDMLDTSYRNITRILETPLAYDSFEVRQVLNEINIARSAVHRVASLITLKEIANEEITEQK